MPDPGDSRRSAEKPTGKAAWLVLETVENAGDWSRFGNVAEIIAEAGAALAGHPRFSGAGAAEACVALSDDAHVRELNSRYRGQDKPTNVLSFPALERGARHDEAGGAASLGDIVLAAETVSREAEAQGIPPSHHLQHLVVHGLLHLIGLDHETDAEAREMETLEVAILARLGIADPYALPPSAAVHSGTRVAADLR